MLIAYSFHFSTTNKNVLCACPLVDSKPTKPAIKSSTLPRTSSQGNKQCYPHPHSIICVFILVGVTCTPFCAFVEYFLIIIY